MDGYEGVKSKAIKALTHLNDYAKIFCLSASPRDLAEQH